MKINKLVAVLAFIYRTVLAAILFIGMIAGGVVLGAWSGILWTIEKSKEVMIWAKVPKASQITGIVLLVLLVICLIAKFWHIDSKSTVRLPKFVIGKGIWIYQTDSCESGDVSAMVKKAKWAGLDYVLVKTHDGSKWVKYNSRERIQEIVVKFHQAGIKVYSWGYVYGSHPEEEAKRAIEALDMGCDGYVFNAEVDMRNKTLAAETQCSLVRSWIDIHDTKKIMGYSTFCRVQNQSGIPFEVYDKYCDVAMPQVYFNWFRGWTSAQAAVNTMVIWQSAQSSWSHKAKPIIPTIESSNGKSDMPETNPADLSAAAKGFKGYYGVNFYSWDVSNEALWKQIKAAPGSLKYQQQYNAEKAWAEATN